MDIYEDEIATKWVIRQAWGEIMNEFRQMGGKPKLVLPKRLQDEAIRRQTEFLEEDPRVGVIQEWLDTKTDVKRVCVLMLWREALGNLFTEPRPQDVNALHTIMKNSVAGWRYVNRQRVTGYGVQRCYERVEGTEFVDVSDENINFG
jgi:hypothetical protein